MVNYNYKLDARAKTNTVNYSILSAIYTAENVTIKAVFNYHQLGTCLIWRHCFSMLVLGVLFETVN